jgi:hypothetical protein
MVGWLKKARAWWNGRRRSREWTPSTVVDLLSRYTPIKDEVDLTAGAAQEGQRRERIRSEFARRHGFGRCPVKILQAHGALVCAVCEGSPVVGLVGDFPVCGDAGCAEMAYRRTHGSVVCD